MNTGNVETLINALIQQYGEEVKEKFIDPETNQLTDRLVMFVNGTNVKNLQGPKTELKDGDLIALFPPSGGGWLIRNIDHLTVRERVLELKTFLFFKSILPGCQLEMN